MCCQHATNLCTAHIRSFYSALVTLVSRLYALLQVEAHCWHLEPRITRSAYGRPRACAWQSETATQALSARSPSPARPPASLSAEEQTRSSRWASPWLGLRECCAILHSKMLLTLEPPCKESAAFLLIAVCMVLLCKLSVPGGREVSVGSWRNKVPTQSCAASQLDLLCRSGM